MPDCKNIHHNQIMTSVCVMFVKDSCQYLDMTNMAIFITFSSFYDKKTFETLKSQY